MQKKSKKPSADAPINISRSISIATVLSVVMCIIVACSIGYNLYNQTIIQKSRQQANELTLQLAKNLADTVGRESESIKTDLNFFLRKSSTEQALNENNINKLATLKRQMQKNIKSIVAIDFFQPNTAIRNDATFPPIRFSELLLINQAQQDKNPKPEIAFIDDTYFYTIALPVASNDEQTAVGVALVRLTPDFLIKVLDQNAELKGAVMLGQKINDLPERRIFSHGEGDAQYKQRAQVANSHFFIDIAPSQSVIKQAASSSVLFFVLLGAAGLIFIAAITFAVRVIVKFIINKLYSSQATIHSQKKSNTLNIFEDDGLRAMLEVEFTEEDEALLGLDEQPELTSPSDPKKAKELSNNDIEKERKKQADNEKILPSHIFRAYDIRGIAKDEISTDIAQKIGRAIGSEVLSAGESSIIVARDARTHSPELTEFLIRGILSSGCDVIIIGTVPTPLLYFATQTLDATNSGVMVTASHNSAEYNGFKIVINGKTRAEADLKAIRQRVLDNNLSTGQGKETRQDIVGDYVDAIFSDVALAREMSVVVDAGNGVSGVVAPRLYEELGCNVTPLYCDLDGRFPHHDPDPTHSKNLQDLITRVKETQADLGIAFDGDGDRIVAVTPKGTIIWPDKLLMLFAKDIVSSNPGTDVVFDVKCTRLLNKAIAQYGGRPILSKTGHAHIKETMNKNGAILGGEYSGHIFIKDRWFGFDDGLYAGARLIELISLQASNLDEILATFPEAHSTPEIRISVGEKEKFDIINKLIIEGDFGPAKISTLDGLRADYGKGWGLARPSNTSPDITLRFEADTQKDLLTIKNIFVRELKKVDKNIDLGWGKST